MKNLGFLEFPIFPLLTDLAGGAARQQATILAKPCISRNQIVLSYHDEGLDAVVDSSAVQLCYAAPSHPAGWCGIHSMVIARDEFGPASRGEVTTTRTGAFR